MISPLDPLEVHHRQRPEKPAFWFIVLASSLLIHGVVMVAMRSLITQAIRVPVDPEPIAVEFAENPDESLSPSLGQPSSSSPQATPSKPLPLAASSSAPLSEPSTSLQTASPTTEATLSIPQSAPPALPVTQPSTSRSVVPPLPSQPASNRGANPDVSSSSADPSLNHHPSKLSSQTPIASGVRLPDVPNVPNPANNPGQVTRSSNLSINSLAIAKVVTPAKFQTQIQLVSGADKDIISSVTALTPATVQGETSKEFISDTSTCLLTPEALSAFGSTVTLKISLDEKGQLQGDPAVIEQESSGNSRYDELAACAVKQWTFSPAYDQVDENTRTFKPSTVWVQVKITE